MTYDLFLTPRGDKLDEESFVEYFNDRENWSFPDDEDPDYVELFNRITGVYFSIHYDAEANHLYFSLNFYRCSPFVLEADMEITDLVEHFDLAVEDSQENGIEGDTYHAKQFFRGWSHGNRWAHRTALADVGTAPLTYDGSALEDIWRWNYNLAFTAEENGGHYVAPPIGFVEIDGVVHTIFVYEADQNMLVPRTDVVCITRGETDVLVPWSALEEALALTRSDMSEDPLDYWAILDTIALRKIAPFFEKGYPSLVVRKLTLTDVHAIDDVDQEHHPDAYADASDDEAT